jgi:hypothetical protein
MRIVHAVTILAVAATLVSGCTSGTVSPSVPTSADPTTNGVADLPAAAILERARTALTAAKSFRVRGGVFHDAIYDGRGRASDPQLWSVDVRIAGADSAGWTAIGASKQESITVGGKRYLRASEQILAQTVGSERAQSLNGVLGDRWVTVPPRLRVFGDFVTAVYVDGLLEPAVTVTKGATKVIGGVRTIALIESGRTTTTIYVATTGEPYPVRLERAELEGLSFTEFGATFPQIQAPPAADVIDLDNPPTQTT